MTALQGEGVVVHRMYCAGREEPVFYGSLASDTKECRHLLVSTLWEHLLAMKAPNPILTPTLTLKGRESERSVVTSLPIALASGPMGRPEFTVGGLRGPAVSFSEGGGSVWAALSADDSDVGIDVATAAEFPGDYPVQRVFHPEELRSALRLADGDRAHACALLWSVKEAAVKALGCAFHRVDPLQVRVLPADGEAAGSDGGYVFGVSLSARGESLFPPAAGRRISVCSRPLSQMWLSLAHLNRRSALHE